MPLKTLLLRRPRLSPGCVATSDTRVDRRGTSLGPSAALRTSGGASQRPHRQPRTGARWAGSSSDKKGVIETSNTKNFPRGQRGRLTEVSRQVASHRSGGRYPTAEADMKLQGGEPVNNLLFPAACRDLSLACVVMDTRARAPLPPRPAPGA